jgi:hypothetical protein
MHISGCASRRRSAPNAAIVYDRFHVQRLAAIERVYIVWSPRRGKEPWTLYVDASLMRSRVATTRAYRPPGVDVFVRPVGTISYRLAGGRVVGRAFEFDEVCALAVEHAPARPPRGAGRSTIGGCGDSWRIRVLLVD